MIYFIFLRFCENIGRKSETNSIKISCIFANVNNILIMENIKLTNGVKMPLLGYGVFRVSPDECERCVSDALKVGLPHD